MGSGVDILKSGGSIIFRAFLQDGSSPIQLVASGTCILSIYELQSDGTLWSYDFSTNTFTDGTLTTEYATPVHQRGNNGDVQTGIWTYVLGTVTGFTVGNIYIVQVENDSAVPPVQSREFQYGGANGDLTINSAGNANADVQSIKTQGVTCTGAVTVPTGTLASTTNITGGTITTTTNLTNAPNDSSGTTTLLLRLTSSRSGYLDNLNVGGLVASHADVVAINVGSPNARCITGQQWLKPASGSVQYMITLLLIDETGAPANADGGTFNTSLTNTANTDRSGNLSGWTNPTTGRYQNIYSVSSSAADEQLVVLLTGTVASKAFTGVGEPVVADAFALAFNSTDRSNLTTVFDMLPDVPYLAGTHNNTGAVEASAMTGNFPGSVASVVAGVNVSEINGVSTGGVTAVDAVIGTAASPSMTGTVFWARDQNGNSFVTSFGAVTSAISTLAGSTGTLDALSAHGDANWEPPETVVVASDGLDNVLIEGTISESASLENDSGTQLTSINLRQMFSVIASALVGQLSGAAGTSIVIAAAGKPSITSRIAATVDTNGNRTAVELTVPD